MKQTFRFAKGQQEETIISTWESRKKKRAFHDRMLFGSIISLFALVVILSASVLSHSTDETLTKAEVVAKKTNETEVAVTTEVMAVSSDRLKAEPKLIGIERDEVFVYNPEIPMPESHQAYLFELCEARGLDYVKTLAVIQHESLFDSNATNETNDYGYFQVNEVNHETLATELQTANSPFNPFINMNWGTYMLADLYQYWEEKGYHGQGLDDAVWSSYNKGITGFKTKGHAVTYVNKMKASIQTIENKF